jgi:hypothetical protein
LPIAIGWNEGYIALNIIHGNQVTPTIGIAAWPPEVIPVQAANGQTYTAIRVMASADQYAVVDNQGYVLQKPDGGDRFTRAELDSLGFPTVASPVFTSTTSATSTSGISEASEQTVLASVSPQQVADLGGKVEPDPGNPLVVNTLSGQKVIAAGFEEGLQRSLQLPLTEQQLNAVRTLLEEPGTRFSINMQGLPNVVNSVTAEKIRTYRSFEGSLQQVDELTNPDDKVRALSHLLFRITASRFGNTDDIELPNSGDGGFTQTDVEELTRRVKNSLGQRVLEIRGEMITGVAFSRDGGNSFELTFPKEPDSLVDNLTDVR